MGSTSLAGLLAHQFGWSAEDVMFTARLDRPITARMALQVLFATCLLLSAIGMARHDRMRDVRFLVAVATPWVCFFTFAPMMHERYLLWGAGRRPAARSGRASA